MNDFAQFVQTLNLLTWPGACALSAVVLTVGVVVIVYIRAVFGGT